MRNPPSSEPHRSVPCSTSPTTSTLCSTARPGHLFRRDGQGAQGRTYCALYSRLRCGVLFVYRPLAHVAEPDCDAFARAMGYPIIPCDLCGSQDGLQRHQVKQMLDAWKARNPGRRQVMFRALAKARPSHLLDLALFDFERPERTPRKG